MPLPVVIVSAPPTVGDTVSRRPEDSGSWPQRRVSVAIAVKRPLSPTTMLRPSPPRIVSPPVPPMMTSSPLPVVTVSSPP